MIDLGGVHGALSSTVSLDSLGLTAGNLYDFDLFFAERNTTESTFTINTSIPLQAAVPEPGSILGVGAGLLALAVRTRRRG